MFTLTPARIPLAQLIEQEPTLTQQELAQRLGVSQPHISKLLKRLGYQSTTTRVKVAP